MNIIPNVRENEKVNTFCAVFEAAIRLKVLKTSLMRLKQAIKPASNVDTALQGAEMSQDIFNFDKYSRLMSMDISNEENRLHGVRRAQTNFANKGAICI